MSKEIFKKYQKECLIAAYDLGYPEVVRTAINDAKTEVGLSNIMMAALKGEFEALASKNEVMANG